MIYSDMKHLDLFSGIGGFAYAVDQVWDNVEHTFVEIDPFCQQVLKKHWHNSKIYGDIRTLTNTINEGLEGSSSKTEGHARLSSGEWSDETPFIVTGGFPCQPFSAAGRRNGTSDDRYLWPEMFRVIQEFQPSWVIAENVYGLVTWNEGMVLEQVCTNLEAEGYEVQPFIIPACGVNATHRRDRVWIIAKNTQCQRSGRGMENSRQVLERQSTKIEDARSSWEKDWIEVATELCSLDDGLPVELGELKLSKAGHRREQLKAYGNAIVPQVAIEILRSMDDLF